jgi:hypothetical protein
MMRAVVSLLALGLATACTQDAPAPVEPPMGAVNGGPDGTDECGAKENAHIIGKNLSDPSVPPASPTVRHIRPGDAVTEDLRVGRLNIYVTGADVIEKINCG